MFLGHTYTIFIFWKMSTSVQDWLAKMCKLIQYNVRYCISIKIHYVFKQFTHITPPIQVVSHIHEQFNWWKILDSRCFSICFHSSGYITGKIERKHVWNVNYTCWHVCYTCFKQLTLLLHGNMFIRCLHLTATFYFWKYSRLYYIILRHVKRQ